VGVVRSVVLVCGPPCAGKTTYVAEHASRSDLIVDYDVIGATEYRRVIRRLPTYGGCAWVIKCLPGRTKREQFADRIKATKTVLLLPTASTLLDRAALRSEPYKNKAAVLDWLKREREDSSRLVTASASSVDANVSGWWEYGE